MKYKDSKQLLTEKLKEAKDLADYIHGLPSCDQLHRIEEISWALSYACLVATHMMEADHGTD